MSEYKILITGGTGFIGSKLCEDLIAKNHQVTVLSRKKSAANDSKKLHYISNLDEQDFSYDIVINLCGEPISQRWTKNKKAEIYHSRIDVTKALVEKILSATQPPQLFISGSAIGYYGTSMTTVFSEKSPTDSKELFSKRICVDWENAAKKAEEKTRLVLLRTAVVIGKNGGMLKKLLLPFKLGLGGKIGSGKQPLSWIHIDDVIGAINHFIENKKLSGAFNLSAPSTSNNLEFSQLLAKNLNRPCLFSTPAFVMKLAFGEMADELLLSGQKVYPKALLESGYNFKFPELSNAIKNSIS